MDFSGYVPPELKIAAAIIAALLVVIIWLAVLVLYT
jgi:hypothetical protein